MSSSSENDQGILGHSELVEETNAELQGNLERLCDEFLAGSR